MNPLGTQELCGFRREAVVKEKYEKDGNSFDATLYGVFRK